MIIAISGTPGTGKHTIARELADKLGYEVLDAINLLKKKDMETLVSVRELNEVISPRLKDRTIVVSHLSHFLTSKEISVFIVLRCDPVTLIKRLGKRGYSTEKIYDNAMFEAIDGTIIEARELHKNVVQVDNTRNERRVVRMLERLITDGRPVKKFSEDYSKRIRFIEKSLLKKGA